MSLAEEGRPPRCHPENVPQELRELRQWVVWREVPRGGRVTKPPYCPRNHTVLASVTDPTSWGTFEEAAGCWWRNQSVVSGIGFILTAADPYFGVDVDDPGKVPGGLTPENAQRRDRLVSGLLATDTYTERSPSGLGLHIIGRGTLPFDGKRPAGLGVEVYGAERFLTVTGHVLNGRATVTDQQELATELADVMTRLAGPDPERGAREEGTAPHRPEGRGDQEVLDALDEVAAARLRAERDAGPGEWSNTFFHAVSALDRATASTEQLRRILMASPLVLAAPPSAAGEARVDKAARVLADALARARAQNNPLMAAAAHGRAAWEGVLAEREREAREAVARADAVVGRLSASAAAIFDAFPQLEARHRTLSHPPGRAGAYARACERACFLPYTKFAVPATLATLSGITGRRYKLPGGQGLNLFFVLVGPSATGKTQTMSAWERFTTRAGGLAAHARRRTCNTPTSSIQAMMEVFQAVPSMVWFNEECGSQLRQMSDDRGHIDTALREGVNRLFDSSAHHKEYSAPKSVAARKAQITPILNLNVSLYWTTVPERFVLGLNDTRDGFLSRTCVVRHAGPAGQPVREQKALDPGLLDYLSQLLVLADETDAGYERAPMAMEDQLVTVDASGVEALLWEVTTTTERVKNRALEEDLPSAYSIVSRLPVSALRMAATLAVADNMHAPVVTREHLLWSFGYLLQNTVELLSDLDQGVVGGGQNDDVTALVRTVRSMLANPRYRSDRGVERSELRNRLRMVKPFSEAKEPSRTVTSFLELMVRDGVLAEVSVPSAGPTWNRGGRPKVYVSPTEDPAWS